MKLSKEQEAFILSRINVSDWTTLDIHTSETTTTYPSGEQLSSSERSAFEELFTSREHAIRAGITIRDENFPVHQWETTRGVSLVYGRRGDAISGCGACVCRASFEDNRQVYCAITYRFPSISANAVSKLVDFVHLLGKVALPNLEEMPVGGEAEPVAEKES